MKKQAELSARAIGDSIQNSAYPDSRYWFWLPSRQWWLYRSVPTLFILALWSVLFYTLLNFLPLLFPVLLPFYAMPLIAVGAALFTYLFGKPLRSLFEPFYSNLYKFVLKVFFAKSESEAQIIIENLTERRSFAQQLVDYARYFFNLRLRDDEEEDKRLRIHIAKFNTRWGAAAKFILNSFFLTTGSMLFIPLIFGISLTPTSTLVLVAFGIFGGICSSLVADNLFGGGLINLAKIQAQVLSPKKTSEAINSSKLSVFDNNFGRVVSGLHALGVGAACFMAGMELISLLGAFSLVASNPFVAPFLLAVIGFCSLAVTRGVYALTFKVWQNKAQSMKGFFSGKDAEGKPVGSLQRLFGFLGVALVGVTISLAFVMLNGSSFAEIIHFPIYNLVGSLIKFNFNPVAIFSFVLTGIVGGIGVAVIYISGSFKLFRDFGKFLDNRISLKQTSKVKFNDPVLESEVEAELRTRFAYIKEENEGPIQSARPTWLYRSKFYRTHWATERFIRTPLIILMNGLATGMLTAVPNVVILVALAPQIAIPMAITLFVVTAFASMCKDYMNWLPGQENRSHAYDKIKANRYKAKHLEAVARSLSELKESVQQLQALSSAQEARSEEDTDTKSSEFLTELGKYAAEFEEIQQLVTRSPKANSNDIAGVLDRVIQFCHKQSADLDKRAEALHDVYDPHLYISLLTGVVRIVSNTVALFLFPFVLFFDPKKGVALEDKQQRSLARMSSVSTLKIANEATASPSQAPIRAQSGAFFAPLPSDEAETTTLLDKSESEPCNSRSPVGRNLVG